MRCIFLCTAPQHSQIYALETWRAEFDVTASPTSSLVPALDARPNTRSSKLARCHAYSANAGRHGLARGLSVGSTNANNDLMDAIAVGKRSGTGPHFSVISASSFTELDDFFTFDPSFNGGALVG